MFVCVRADLKSRGCLCSSASLSSFVFGDGHLEVGVLEELDSRTQNGYCKRTTDTDLPPIRKHTAKIRALMVTGGQLVRAQLQCYLLV